MYKLILYNDNKNSINYVIACLIRFLQYNFNQSEQTIIIAEKNGKVPIKEGDYLELLEMKNTFTDYNLKVDIE